MDEKRKELLILVNKAIEKKYKSLKKHIEIDIMNGSEVMYDMTSEDIANEAIAEYLNYLSDKVETVLDYEDLDSYIGILLRSRAKQVITARYRHNRVKLRAGHLVKDALYDDENPKNGLMEHELVELRNMNDQLPNSFKVVKKIFEEEGIGSTRRIMEKFDIAPGRAFYRMKDNLKKSLEDLGYEQE